MIFDENILANTSLKIYQNFDPVILVYLKIIFKIQCFFYYFKISKNHKLRKHILYQVMKELIN